MQYRAGRPGKAPEFVYPSQLVSPKGFFQFGLLAQGAQLSFTSGKYLYEINELLKTDTIIYVSKDGKYVGNEITCHPSSETLTLTTTMNRFKLLGIY
jgi:hypothetical protein